MDFLKFKTKMFDFACFSINQIYAWQADFDRNNISRWLKKGYIFRLKQGYYAFSEYKSKPDYTFYFANKIYNPSYISLYSALSFYGIIPEAVVQITSVTPLKTSTFSNDIGDFSYKTIKPDLMFGYCLKFITEAKAIKIATPEKAILDLLYLYPFYKTEQDLEDLRFEEEYLLENIDKAKLESLCTQFKTLSLEKRVSNFFKVYNL